MRAYDPDLWRTPDRVWALTEAAKPSGFMPFAESTVRFLKVMELEGFVRQADTAPVWYITDAGRAELDRLIREPVRRTPPSRATAEE